MRVSEPRTLDSIAKVWLHSTLKPVPLLLLFSILLLFYTYFNTFEPNLKLNAPSGSHSPPAATSIIPSTSTTSLIALRHSSSDAAAADGTDIAASNVDSSESFISAFLASRRPMDRALRSREEFRRRSIRRVSNPIRQLSWAEVSEERRRDEDSHDFAFVEVPAIGTLSSSPPPPKDTLEYRMRQRALKEKEVRDFERRVRQRQKELDAQRQYEYWQQLAEEENEKEREAAAAPPKSQRTQIRIVADSNASKSKPAASFSKRQPDGDSKSHTSKHEEPAVFVEPEAKQSPKPTKRSRRTPKSSGN